MSARMGFFQWLFGSARRALPAHVPEPALLPQGSEPVRRGHRGDGSSGDELQLILLSRFLKGRSANDVPAHWDGLLGESSLAVVKRYIKYGELVPMSLVDTIEHCSKVPDLKSLLKARGLKMTGRKRELAERLMEADRAGVSALYGGQKIFECSPDIRVRVERYRADKEREYVKLLTDATTALRCRDFAKASQLIGTYESKQLRVDPPNPFALPADPREIGVDVTALKQIFTLRPKLLRALPEAEWDELHIVAGLNYLLGGRVSGDGLSDNFVGVPTLDRHTVVRMMQFHIQYLRDLERFRSAGFRQAKILCCNADSCEPCMTLAGKRFRLDRLPELPYEKCTSDLGCRCCLTAVIPGFD
jgi:hypothetical protein